MSEQEYLLAGREAWQRQDWQTAIHCYDQAISRNPESEAVELRRMAMDILDFYNKDMYNP